VGVQIRDLQAQALPPFSAPSKHPTHGNARNSITVVHLLYTSRHTQGRGTSFKSKFLSRSSGTSTHHGYSLFTTTHFFINGNKLGSAGGESAMASNSGYCSRNGSGTFTLERFKMLINWRALTTPLPW
jgi:hypothetical protein